MKVLFSLTYYTPYVSGLTLYVKRLSEALVKKGYDITVLSINFDKKDHVVQFVNGVRVVRADYFAKISKGFISIDWLTKSWEEVRKADVVIINLPQFEGVIPALFGRILGKKVIAIYHCDVILPEGILNFLAEKALLFSNYLSLSLSEKIISYTKDFADNSFLLKQFKNKVVVIYPPVPDIEVNKRIPKILRDKITGPSDFVIGVAARLAAEKGIEYLLESIPVIKSELSVIPTDPDLIGRVEGSMETRDSSTSLGMTRIVKESKIKIVIAGSLNPVRKLWDGAG